MDGIGHGSGRGSSGSGDSASSAQPASPLSSLRSNPAGQGFGSGAGRLGGSHRSRPPTVRMATPNVSGRMAPEVIHRVIRQRFWRIRRCYDAALQQQPGLAGTATVRFLIDRAGLAHGTRASGPFGEPMLNCIKQTFMSLRFPQTDSGNVTVRYPIRFGNTASSNGSASGSPNGERARPRANKEEPKAARPYTGRLAKVMALLSAGERKAAWREAKRWQASAPGHVPALLALGETLEAKGETAMAARAYGSIIDLFPGRAEMQRFAAGRLLRLDTAAAAIARDASAAALRDRPDHLTAHRDNAYAWLRAGKPRAAFEALD